MHAGVQPGDRVAILALNSDRYFELMYAIPWLGAVMVPVNTRLATPEIQYILEDSGARVLFVDDAMQSHADALAVEAMFYLDDDAPPAGMRPYEEFATADPVADAGAGGETLAGLFYTGGTTGKSKGVMLSHNNLVWNAMNVIVEVENAISLMPEVAEVAVIGIPDDKWGETVHAVVVPGSGASLTAEAVIEHCHTQIAGYKCPRSVEIRDTPLPLSGAGKVLKRELRESFTKVEAVVVDA